MTTKPTILCPNCHEPISLEQAEDSERVRCDRCGTEVVRAEQPGDVAH